MFHVNVPVVYLQVKEGRRHPGGVNISDIVSRIAPEVRNTTNPKHSNPSGRGLFMSSSCCLLCLWSAADQRSQSPRCSSGSETAPSSPALRRFKSPNTRRSPQGGFRIMNMFLTCSSRVPDMFLTCSSHVPDVFLTCSWCVPHVFLTYSSRVPDVFLTCSSRVPDVFLTCSWRVTAYCTN